MSTDSYSTYPYHVSRGRARVPFVELVGPFHYLGECVLDVVTSTPGAIRLAFRQIRRRVRERQTMSSLRALDERTLKDIGISRSEIPAIARRAAQQSVTRVGVSHL